MSATQQTKNTSTVGLSTATTTQPTWDTASVTIIVMADARYCGLGLATRAHCAIMVTRMIT